MQNRVVDTAIPTQSDIPRGGSKSLLARYPLVLMNDYGSNVPVLIGLGTLALVIIVLTRGRLGYQYYQDEVPDSAIAPT
jgi:hypothetical protein